MAASPLTKGRPGSERAINYDKRPLAANAKAWKRGLAACLAGYYQPASGDPNEEVVGTFAADVDNTGGADGAKLVNIKFFRERRLFLLDNDASALVTITSREKPVSVLDDHTATLLTQAAGTGVICYDVVTEGVWVEFVYPASSDDAGVPRIQSGTSTLVAGTKTITGVTLTANSRIVITMKDPGAGALTGMAGFDAPVASRNTSTGQFVVNAIDDTKATIAAAVCTFDYLIVG